MFHAARIKLTAWYLLIIMLVSMSFSVAIYRTLSSELDRLGRVELLRQQRRLPPPLIGTPNELTPAILDPDVIAETQQRLILRLLGINVLILVGSAVAGYFLAGKTLEPISDMMDEQNRFITDASHELRTPLTSLKSEIEVNLRNKNLTVKDAQRLLRSNLEEVNNLQALSDGLIKLTQFSTKGDGNNGLDVTKLPMGNVLKEAIRRVSIPAKAKNIAITDTTPNLSLTGNAMLLTELFVILLDNAIKYSARGKSIRITGQKIDGHVIVKVMDQGYGINKEDISHLFDRFWRADKSRTKTATPGYGLGLAIAKQIVDRHFGTIEIESTKGIGTTFSIKLPINHTSKK